MLSIRIKLTLAFLLVNLITVLIMGGIARFWLVRSFNYVETESAFIDFQEDIAAYINQYGSWEEAAQVESFLAFEERRRAVEALIGAYPLQTDTALEAPGAVPPPEAEHPQLSASRRGRTPFQFLLVDAQGRALLPPGANVPLRWRRQAYPIQTQGNTAVFALKGNTSNLNQFDRQYLQVINRSLGSSLVVSALVAAALGLVVAARVSRSIRLLISAVEAMEAGDLRQQVHIDSEDEIGRLGIAFNQMSTRLARAYEDLETSYQAIREISIRDELTQLYNRRFFNEQIELLLAQAHRYGQPLSLMIGDVDYFKRINDHFSHQVGDRVLQQVGLLLKTHARSSDVVARYGGEEFIIALPCTTQQEAVRFCDRIRKEIQTYPWATISADLQVTMSIGISTQQGSLNLHQLLSTADRRLYRAKHSGRNRICYAEEIQAYKEATNSP